MRIYVKKILVHIVVRLMVVSFAASFFVGNDLVISIVPPATGQGNFHPAWSLEFVAD